MITVKLWGGLGNQLFQYAYGLQLAKKAHTGIILDTSWFSQQDLRKPEILDLDIQFDRVEETWKTNKKIAFLNKKIPNRGIRIPRNFKHRVGGVTYLKETRFHYMESIRNFSASEAYVDGYWQCPRYFEDVSRDLQSMFVPTSIREAVWCLGQQLRQENSVAVHVRRGDYPAKKGAFHRLATIHDEYYTQAVAYMQQHNSGAKYYLFSNDPADAANMIKPLVGDALQTFEFGARSALEEWYLMRCCQHQIIGNSTFSWWAAYLNDNPKKIVCAPDYNMGNDDIIPEEWIKFRPQ